VIGQGRGEDFLKNLLVEIGDDGRWVCDSGKDVKFRDAVVDEVCSIWCQTNCQLHAGSRYYSHCGLRKSRRVGPFDRSQ
jgi:hypothetical protein